MLPWIKNVFTPQPSRRKAGRRPLVLEALEERALPSAALPFDLGTLDLFTDPVFSSNGTNHHPARHLGAVASQPVGPAGNVASAGQAGSSLATAVGTSGFAGTWRASVAASVLSGATAGSVGPRTSVHAGYISTVAGNGTQGFYGDGGPATAAALNLPGRVAVDRSGDIFIADAVNMRVREVSALTGTITTIAGDGSPGSYGMPIGDGGPATAAHLYLPDGVAVDASGNVFIADRNHYRVREVSASTGIITTIAGSGNAAGFSGDGGPATAAQLGVVSGVAVDGNGNVFIVDAGGGGNNRIREVSAATGDINTIAGNGTYGFSGDGGPATAAQLAQPLGVAVDQKGDVFIADTFNNRVREVSGGIINTIAGNGGTTFGGGNGGPATEAQLDKPQDVAVDGNGNVFIAEDDDIREVAAATGTINTIAGTPGSGGFGGDGGPATSAALFAPGGVALDGNGNLVVADTDNNRIREIFAVGASSTGTGAFFTDGNNQLWLYNGQFVNTGGFAKVFSAGVDQAGAPECWFLDGNNQLWKWDNGTFTNTGGFAQKIAAGKGFVAFSDGINQLWTFTDGGTNFTNTGGFASRFTAGFDSSGKNQIDFADGINQLWTYSTATKAFTNTGGFTKLFVAGQDAAGNNEIWFTDGNNQIWRLDQGTFSQTSGFALTITGSGGGQAYFSDGVNQVWLLTDAGAFTNTGGFAAHISSSPGTTALFFSDGINQLWEYSNGNFINTGGFASRFSAF